MLYTSKNEHKLAGGRSKAPSMSGQPDAFTLTDGTFLTLPPSSILTLVIPPSIAMICVEVNT